MPEDQNSNHGNGAWGDLKKAYATDPGVLPPITPGDGSSSTSSSDSNSTPGSDGSEGSTSTNE